jgi:hypothetical protein
MLVYTILACFSPARIEVEKEFYDTFLLWNYHSYTNDGIDCHQRALLMYKNHLHTTFCFADYIVVVDLQYPTTFQLMGGHHWLQYMLHMYK